METHLRESCKEIIVEVSPTSLKFSSPIPHTLLELIPAPFTCSPPSPSLECSLVNTMDDYVINDLDDYLGLVDIEKE